MAAAEPEIAEAVTKAGGKAVLTDPDHPSGSDRIFEALRKVDPRRPARCHRQPAGRPADHRSRDRSARVLEPLADAAVDIATLAVEITRDAERADPNVVKAVAAFDARSRHIARALYFSRATVPANDGPHYHHIGIYAYRRAALERFVALPPGLLEQREKLEQLRALEAGMRIDVALVDTVPLGVDTPAELERARAILAQSTS